VDFHSAGERRCCFTSVNRRQVRQNRMVSTDHSSVLACCDATCVTMLLNERKTALHTGYSYRTNVGVASTFVGVVSINVGVAAHRYW
jgi:hypothetical protein